MTNPATVNRCFIHRISREPGVCDWNQQASAVKSQDRLAWIGGVVVQIVWIQYVVGIEVVSDLVLQGPRRTETVTAID